MNIISIFPDDSLTFEDFFKYKQPLENIGIASIAKNDINFEFNIIPEDNPIVNFFKVGRYIDTKFLADVYKNHYNVFSLNYLECIPKLAWLLDEYSQKYTFNNPIGLIYNPSKGKFDIHPGQTRKYILNAHKTLNTVDAVVFNTGEHKVEFKTIFNSSNEVINYFKNRNVEPRFRKAYNTIIPELNLNAVDIPNRVVPYLYKSIEVFSNYSLHADFDLRFYGYPRPTKKNNNIIIETNKSTDIGIQILSIAAASLGRSIEFEDIKISVYTNE